MCRAMEDMRNESWREGMQRGMQHSMEKTALRMLGTGKYGLREVAAISGLPLEEVKKLQAGQGV